jgi:4-diphosphocytidyl-2-C-methyl-D-erythritol kinase
LITVKAPAKINLTLEVLGKRPDDYHEIRSVLQSIDLYDTLDFSDARDITVTCDLPGWAAEKSQVSKAVALLQEHTGSKKGAEIRIAKRIPLQAGLGGDSSDGAATLKGLNELWKLKLYEEKLLMLAARLGSDTPFFIRGGTAEAAGRGEIIAPLPAVKKMRLVLVIPDIPVEPGKTARAYAALKPSHYTDGTITRKLADIIKAGKAVRTEALFNVFEDVAVDVHPGLSYYISGCIRSGVPVYLAGAGPALFAIFHDQGYAEEFCKIAEEHQARAYNVETL